MTAAPSPQANRLADIKLPMPLWELVALVAALMSLNALAIDIMLPALDEVSAHYKLLRANDQQLIVFSYVIGFGTPQLVFGPLTDRIGRRNLLRLCLLAYAILGFACMATRTFELLLLVRFLNGVAASGVRVIAVSIVRDLVQGRGMARIMSLVMTVFMVVPILAPGLGQMIMHVSSWQWTFGVLGLAGLALLLWVQLRLPETLPPEKRKVVSFKKAVASYIEVLRVRVSLGYMLASGVVFGGLFAFIGAAEQIFSDTFHVGDEFVVWFAGIAATLAIANYTNSRLVERFGMRRICHGALLAFIILAILNVFALKIYGEKLLVFFPLFALSFGCFGMIGANFSAIALEPQGKNTGTASAAYGFFTTTFASGFGWLVARQFDGSVVPILFGYMALGIGALIIVLITERGKLFETGTQQGN
ncbi:MAG: multidrug effflux MFS transporter [Robiginitomaculum sp.]